MPRLVQTNDYSIREVVGGPCEVTDDAWNAVVQAVEFGIEKLQLPYHVFLTVVGAPGFCHRSDPEDSCCGIYREGIQDISRGRWR